jgi:hypothetical protein
VILIEVRQSGGREVVKNSERSELSGVRLEAV